jgi:hypothetical protein
MCSRQNVEPCTIHIDPGPAISPLNFLQPDSHMVPSFSTNDEEATRGLVTSRHLHHLSISSISKFLPTSATVTCT